MRVDWALKMLISHTSTLITAKKVYSSALGKGVKIAVPGNFTNA